MGIERWNKIIDISFQTDAGVPLKDAIVCPRTGRKPNIEITGLMTQSQEATSFSIKIKNYYFDTTNNQYQRVTVGCGYVGSVAQQVFSGSINRMYKDFPGPEGTTVIDCIDSPVTKWLGEASDYNFDKGFSLRTAVEKICQVMGLDPDIAPDITEVSSAPLQIQAGGMEVIKELRARFPDVVIVPFGKTIRVYKTDGLATRTHTINYLSAPIQLQGGGTTKATAIITAPWMPEVKPGDIVIINSSYYATKSTKFHSKLEKSKFKVATVQFNFSTTTTLNQMVVLGTAI